MDDFRVFLGTIQLVSRQDGTEYPEFLKKWIR